MGIGDVMWMGLQNGGDIHGSSCIDLLGIVKGTRRH